MKILLTHSPEARALYYGERALAGLRKVGDVRLHEDAAPLEGDALIAAAADCDLIVSYRQSPGPAAVCICASSPPLPPSSGSDASSHHASKPIAP